MASRSAGPQGCNTTLDDKYLGADMQTVLAMGVAPGDIPTMLCTFFGLNNTFFFRKTDASFTTIIEVLLLIG